CQRYDLRRIGLGELRAHLRRTVDAERLVLSDEALALVAREAEGSLRDAQSLLEQVLTVAGRVADAVLAGDPGACVRHLAELHAHGYDAQRFCRDLLEHFRHLAVLAATGERALMAELPEAEVDALAAQAGRRSADDLQRFFRLLLEADEALAAPARSVDPKLVLEMCAVRLATLPPLLPLDDILRRLEVFGAGNPAASGGAVRESAPRARGAAPGGLWDRFLVRVQEEKLVAPYMMLLSGTLLAADGEALRIGIENEAARRE